MTSGCNKCETVGDYPGIREDTGGQTVFLHNGEFFTHAVDLEIPGRGFNWKFERKYRSGIIFDGPLGHNWEFNYNRRLFVEPFGVLRMDGSARADRYELIMGRYRAPTGFYTQLVENADGSFVERDKNGARVFYTRPDAHGIALMEEIRDRNGNRMRFEYNGRGQLVRVIDTLGRPIDYFYNEDGRLIEVRDFFDRSIRFQYDRNGNLVAVTSPTVIGTPNGNDFPQGKTTQYSYSSGFREERLNHNLLTITAPNEVASGGEPRVQIEYDTDPSSPNVDRVLRQTVGGINAPAEFAKGQVRIRIGEGVPAGGTISYEYEFLGSGAEDDFILPITQTTVTDRNGNVTEYRFNQIGNIVTIREFTNRNVRPSDPEFFETRYEYNKDGEMTRMIYPEGNSVEYDYDDKNPMRFQQGNLMAEIKKPDARRGGDETIIRTNFTYEPIYNQVRTETEARGNDPDYVPQNGGINSPSRYTTVYIFDYQEGDNFVALAGELGVRESEVRELLQRANIPMGLGDVNGDGRTDQIAGNVVKMVFPTVNLLRDSNQVHIEGGTHQPIEKTYVYNQVGQVTKEVDPEGNVTIYDYHPENDPDGDGLDPTADVSDGPFGYLKGEIRDAQRSAIRNSRTDPEPTRIRMQYLYDRVGNVIRHIDGRGIATDYVVNELNQVVQTIRAAAHDLFSTDPPEPLPLVDFRYLERIFYDFNDNVIRRQIEDRGNTSSVGGDNSAAAFVDYEYTFDILDKRIEMREEVSDSEDLITRTRYDPNENQVLEIYPEGNAMSYIYDERDLKFQSTRGAPAPPMLALLGPSDPTSYDVRGGVPSTMTFHYDLNRNLNEEVDADDTDGSAANNSKRGGFGDRTRYIYDGFDRRTSVVDSVGDQTVTQYDPASNVVRVSRFGPVRGPSSTSDGPDRLPMPVSSGGVIQAGNLVNRNLLEATESLYDELNRLFQTDRVLFLSPIATNRPPDVADGAADIGKGNLTPGDSQAIPGMAGIPIIGRVTTRTEYDRSSRRSFTVEDDGDTSSVFYDGANRVIKSVDPENNVMEWAYDDNNNVIETRETDVSQVKGVANEIFLTTMFYDSLNRRQRSVDNIGQTIFYRYDSRDNQVGMGDAEGPVTSASINRRAFDGGPLTVNSINDFGNVTLYFYDGINRKLREDRVLTASGIGKGASMGVDIFGLKQNNLDPDPNQSGDGLISLLYDWDKNTLLTSLTDDNGNQTQYTYDNLNRKLTETKGISVSPKLADRDDPDTTITYEYDRDDNVFRMTDENGSVINCRFDAINRVVACNITRARAVTGTTAESYEYDGLSRPTHATDNNEPTDSSDDSVITYAYDSLSRIIEETQQIGNLSAKVISSGWRAENLRDGLVYPNDRVLVYTYDLLDRLNSVGDQGADLAIANYDYLGKWRVAERAYPLNGTRMTYLDDNGNTDIGYDGLRRTVQLRHVRDDNSLIVGFTHAYDRQNNKLFEEKLHDPSNSELYDYDSVYRVIDFQRGQLNGGKTAITTPTPTPDALQRQQWTLDGVGNWSGNNLTHDGHMTNEVRKVTTFNEYSQIGSVANEQDDNGNLLDDGTLRFQWDYKDRLRIVTRKSDNALIAVYTYDARNRRVRKVVTNSGSLNGTTDFYYDSWQVVEERDSTDTLVQEYVYGIYIDEPLVMNRNLDGDNSALDPNDQRLFYHQNTLFSTFGMTDATGKIVEGYEYATHGHTTVYAPGGNGKVDFGGDDVMTPEGASGLGNPYLFTGRRHDPSTGLYYYRTRYLDPVAGRFTTRDTIGIWGDITNLGNGYTYIGSNPFAWTDPLGLVPGLLVQPMPMGRGGRLAARKIGQLAGLKQRCEPKKDPCRYSGKGKIIFVIMEFRRDVSYQIGGEGAWIAAKRGARLPEGTRLRTGFRSSVELRACGRDVHIRPVTQLTITRYLRDPEKDKHKHLDIRDSGLTVPVRRDRTRTDMRVTTPSNTTGVVG